MRKRTLLLGGVAVVLAAAALFDFTTHVGRGWWRGEAFYQGRPASWWSVELEAWHYRPFC
jgi:hypothetical protein